MHPQPAAGDQGVAAQPRWIGVVFDAAQGDERRVAGLDSLVRVILTLADAGVKHIRVVAPDHAVSRLARLRRDPRLAGVRLDVLHASAYAEGIGTPEISACPRVVVRSDRVYSPAAVASFLAAAAAEPMRPAAAVDPHPRAAKQLPDAALVSVDGCEAVSTGLIYLPPHLSADLRAAARDSDAFESALLTRLSAHDLHLVTLDNGAWHVVRDARTVRVAERKLSQAMGVQPSTWLGRYLTQPLTAPAGRFLARRGMRPLAVQVVVFLLACVSAYFAAAADYTHVALGGAMFYLATLLERGLEDLMRLTFRRTRTADLVSAVMRNLRYAMFFAGLGVGAYRAAGPSVYVYAVVFSAGFWVYLVGLMLRYALSEEGELAELVSDARLALVSARGQSWWDRTVLRFGWLVKPEVVAVLVAVFCILGLAAPLFWLSLLALVATTVSFLRLLVGEDPDRSRELTKNATSFLFYLVGIGILLALIARLPFAAVVQTLNDVGIGAISTILLPFTWAVASAFGVAILIGPKYNVGFRSILYSQITGDAFNTIIPLMGLGGEPYKAKYLSRFVPLGVASRAIVHSRLVHAMSGVLFTGVMMVLANITVELEAKIAMGLWLVAGLMFVLTGVLVWVTMSRLPSRATGFVLGKLKIERDYEHDLLTWRQMLLTLLFKIAARSLKLFELYVIFLLVGIQPTLGQVILVEAAIMASASLLFVVPQGLGVNEAGITAAFVMLGLPAHIGLTYGLIRRARVVVWGMIGLTIYVFGTMWQRGWLPTRVTLRRSA